ncbi:MAG TPA: DinB family protein [Gemmatimonadaceae bacterium]|nr:DinB family protein [Gemmatimonadaceae bacterium]
MEITTIPPFLSYWSSVRGRTRRVVEAIPGDRIDWSLAPGRWSFADVVRHLGAIERWMYAETVSGRPSRYSGHGPELADGADAVRAYLDRMHAESVAIFQTLTAEQLAGKCLTPAGTPITVGKWLRAMVEHEAHHRGQLYLMLNLLGVKTPPLYGLTEEEVVERSGDRGPRAD